MPVYWAIQCGWRPDLFWNVLTSSIVKERPRVPAGTRVYAIGDVHGRADLLTQLFLRIDQDLLSRPVADPIHIFLGDYIDRGPDSRRVVEALIQRKISHQAVFLKGNHEECALGFLSDPGALSWWRHIGGLSTILSYGVSPRYPNNLAAQQEIATALGQAMPPSHVLFFRGLALSFTCGDFFFVHAGVRPRIPLERQSQDDLLGIRDEFLLHEEDFGKVVVHGHTPVEQPEIHTNRINIDTGAYASGRLTCLVLEDDQMSFL
jgi:serine/threonine protein phosphatase 1